MGRKKKKSLKINTVTTTEKTTIESKHKNTIEDQLNYGNTVKMNQTSATTILDISSRLNLPLKPSEIDLTVDSDDEETLEFHIRPRFVYVCNLCLVCMNVCSTEIRCNDCQMVSYCSEQHKNDNKRKHMELCKALCEICDGMKGHSLAKGLPPDLYRTFRIKTIDIIEQKMGRRLDLWEREILLYPRICRTCKKIDQDLNYCLDCGIDFFCKDHQLNHLKWCKDLQVFKKVLSLQYKHGHVNPEVPVVYYKEPHVLPENFDSLIYSMCDNSPNYRQIDCYTYACLSSVATAPLTALFAMQTSIPDWRTKTKFNIHVIGAEFQFECASLKVWELLFLHFLPNLKNLCIEFTGPELYLPGAPPELLGKIKMCKRCKLSKRKIDVFFNSQKLYHKTENKTKADLICLFNPGLYRETGYDGTDTWPDTIKKFCKSKVPIVVTSYTEFEIPRDLERIRSICNIQLLLGPQKNPYATVKPDRNFVSDDVSPLMYKNHCISIVIGL